eukprot:gene26465-37835_t
MGSERKMRIFDYYADGEDSWGHAEAARWSKDVGGSDIGRSGEGFDH